MCGIVTFASSLLPCLFLELNGALISSPANIAYSYGACQAHFRTLYYSFFYTVILVNAW